MLLAVLVVGGGIAAALLLTDVADRATQLVSPDDEDQPDEPAASSTAVVLVTGDEEPGGDAHGIAVLAFDADAARGTIVLVPPSTIADVPGYGTEALGEAYASDGGELVGLGLSNLLGLRFDTVATISPDGWDELFSDLGGYRIEVVRDVDGQAPDGGSARFSAGAQQLDGTQLADYLTLEVEGESELDALPRAQQVLVGLLEELAEAPQRPETLFADDATRIESEDPQVVQRVFEQLATAHAQDAVTILTLPVSSLGSDGGDGYQLDTERAEELAEGRLEAFAPQVDADGRRVQILNGNGVPRIGQHVAGLLSGGGYQIVLTGNADRFTYDETRIIVHADDAEQLEVARDIQDRLGTGVIERAATPQSVVDVTIVVGADVEPSS
ncbi:MAG: LCP family protein [Nitriliruptoraceae bacterium]